MQEAVKFSEFRGSWEPNSPTPHETQGAIFRAERGNDARVESGNYGGSVGKSSVFVFILFSPPSSLELFIKKGYFGSFHRCTPFLLTHLRTGQKIHGLVGLLGKIVCSFRSTLQNLVQRHHSTLHPPSF